MNTRRVFYEIEAEIEVWSICTIENIRLSNKTDRYKKNTMDFISQGNFSINFVIFHFYF